jgi:hypothetical protein
MQLVYQKHMRALWRLAGDIGTLGENGNDSYAAVYEKLSDALDIAEATGLIADKEDKPKRKRKAKG